MQRIRALMLAAAALPGLVDAQEVRQSARDADLVRFVVRVENVSTNALRLSSSDSSNITLSAVAWAVHTGRSPFFTPGEVDPGRGLELLAESGRPAPILLSIANQKSPAIRTVGFENNPVGGNRPGMLDAGRAYEFDIEARAGDRLSFVMMLGESNDGLIGTGPAGIDLFRASRPVSGDFSAQLALWDAGTEVNEEPGIGRNQGMRQGAPHAGDPERKPVRPMAEAEFGGMWPAASRILRLTVTPKAK